MVYEPLASRLRPKSFHEVIGQGKLIAILERMLAEDKLVSIILYGPTGVGKTTLALLIAEHFPLNHFKFNASTDSKASLKQIVDAAKFYGNVLLIVDEIHRMNRDIQDYLLPHVETGKVILVGLTTENPYIAVNPAIRSRVSIFRLERPGETEIREYIKNIDLSLFNKNVKIPDPIYEYISISANGEVRTAINMLEMLMIQAEEKAEVTLDFAREVLGKASISADYLGDNYYDILSAFHKSVRGSDVDAALHYLARLIVAGDLESLLRRISAIVYEDIGLANPGMGPKVAAMCDVARHIGFPEAINGLGAITIEMCLSPKSNSAHLAVNKAIADVESGKTYKIPSHLINNPTYDDKSPYKYAHDFPGHIVEQEYMPQELAKTAYYEPQDHTKIEKMFHEQYESLKKLLGKK